MKLTSLIKEDATKLSFQTRLKETAELLDSLTKSIEETNTIAKKLAKHAQSVSNSLDGKYYSDYESNKEASDLYQQINSTADGDIVYTIEKDLRKSTSYINKMLDKLKQLK